MVSYLIHIKGEKTPNHYATKHFFQRKYQENMQIPLEFSSAHHLKKHSAPQSATSM